MSAFDVLSVSFSTELGYTNLLTALDLAGIPLDVHLRGEDHPLAHGAVTRRSTRSRSLIRGHGAVVGDGEQAVLRISDLVKEWKLGRGGPGGRLLRLATAGGVYVPRFYDVTTADGADPAGGAESVGRARQRVTKHTVSDLDEWPYPQCLVPLAETVHERMSVEIFRGCTRGGRFCQAGMATVRSGSGRSPDRRDGGARAGAGFEEVGRPQPAPARTTPRSRASPRGSPTATRGPTPVCRCRAPACSTPSNIDLANQGLRNRRSGAHLRARGAASGCGR